MIGLQLLHIILFPFLYIGQIIPSVHSVGRVSSSHIFIINLCILDFNSVLPCFISSAGILSDPAAVYILSFSIDLLHDIWVGVPLQHNLKLCLQKLVPQNWHSWFVSHRSIVTIFVECLHVLKICYHFCLYKIFVTLIYFKKPELL